MQTKEYPRQPAGQDVEQLAEGIRPRPAPRLLEYEVEDDLVLYDPRRDVAHILNSTAAAVWWLCDGRRVLKDISARLAGLYGLEAAEVRQDVQEVISGLRQVGLLESS